MSPELQLLKLWTETRERSLRPLLNAQPNNLFLEGKMVMLRAIQVEIEMIERCRT